MKFKGKAIRREGSTFGLLVNLLIVTSLVVGGVSNATFGNAPPPRDQAQAKDSGLPSVDKNFASQSPSIPITAIPSSLEHSNESTITWGAVCEQAGIQPINHTADVKVKVVDKKVRMIVGFYPSHKFDHMAYQATLFATQASIQGTIEQLNAIVAQVPISSLKGFIDEWHALDGVRYVEPSRIFSIQATPNDPDWSLQWGSQKIQADLAWDIQMGDPTSVLVAVIDSGIDYTHPDLSDHYVPLGYDWVNDDPDPMDDYGHGTHCAGIIAAMINNSLGIAGVANISIMAEKALNATGSGSDIDLADAIVNATDAGADIISNSWGGNGVSSLIESAVVYAAANDVVIVAAAGNDATDDPFLPAYYQEVISVSATDNTDNLAGFSNYGDTIEIAAPGVNIYSTIPGNNYAYKSGTSMACPFVSAVAALILSEFPTWSADEVRLHLSKTADDLGTLGWDQYFGYGRLNAYRAVQPPLSTITFWEEDFEGGIVGWTATDLWHLIDNTSPYPEYNSPVHSWYYGDDATGTYDTGARNWGWLISPIINLPSEDEVEFHIWSWYETEDTGPMWDIKVILISTDYGGSWTPLGPFVCGTMLSWRHFTFIISAYAGLDVQFAFYFDTLDGTANNYRGWYIDDLSIESADTTAPAVTIKSPLNTTYATNSIPVYATNTTEPVDTAWYRYNNGSWYGNYTLTWDGGDNQWENESLTFFDDTYHLQVFCNDSTGNEGYDEEWFTVDTTVPSVLITSPTNKTYGTTSIDVTATNASDVIDQAWYRYKNSTASSWSSNTSMTYAGSNQWQALSQTFPEETYHLQVFFNDTAGNEGYDVEWFTVDTTAPSVLITSPTNKSYAITSIDVTATNASDVIDQAWYRYKNRSAPSWSANTSMIYAGSNQWQALSQAFLEESYHLQVFFNDTAGNEGYDEEWFTVDLTAPAVDITNPSNKSYATTSIDVIATNASDVIDQAWYRYKNSTASSWSSNASMSYAGSNQWQALSQAFPEESYHLQVFFNDTAGNEAYDEEWFIVDTTAPSVLITSPTNKTYPTTSIDVIATNASDVIDQAWYRYKNSTASSWSSNTSMSYAGSNQWQALSQTFPEESYHLQVFFNDTTGNEGYDEEWFTVNITAPTVQITSPTNKTYPTTSIDVTATNASDVIDQAWYWYKNSTASSWSTNTTMSYVGSNQWQALSQSFPEESYHLQVFFNDTAGNEAYDDEWFTVDTTAPTEGQIDSPSGWQTSNDLTVVWSGFTDAGSGIAGYYVYYDAITPVYETGTAHTFYDIPDGWHTWHVYAVDNTGNTGPVRDLDFGVDTTPPIGGQVDSPSGWQTSDDQTVVWSGFTDTGSGITGYYVYYDAITPVYEVGTSHTFYDIPDGWHTWYVYAVDNTGNPGSVRNLNFGVDTTPPLVSIISPQNTTYTTSMIPVYATNTTEAVDKAWYRYNNGSWYRNYTLAWNITYNRWQNESLTLADSTYQLQVFCNDSVGNEGYEIEWFTVDTTEPGGITDLAISNPTTTSLMLTWTAPGDDGTTGNATGYEMRYSTLEQITDATWGSATSYTQTWIPQKNGTLETRVVSELSVGTQYWFAIKAYDEVGNYGPISNSPSGTTSSPPPPTPPPSDDGDGDGDGDGDEDKDRKEAKKVPEPPADTDGDGLIDSEEVDIYGTDPQVADTDGDGLPDGEEITIYGTNATAPDTDADGLSDHAEVALHGTNPTLSDSDGDGLTDGAEVNVYHTDPMVADAEADTDGDGLLNVAEIDEYGTNPTMMDTDRDSLTDREEVTIYNTDPTSMDTDDDGLTDGEEVTMYGTNPTVGDTDEDGLSDWEEVSTHSTNPTVVDTDGDGITDFSEIKAGTNPLDPHDPKVEVTTVPEFPFEFVLLTAVVLGILRKRKRS